LTLLYSSYLEEGALEVDRYVKSMEAVWRRLQGVDLKLAKELVVFMTLVCLAPPFGVGGKTQVKQSPL